MIQVFGCRAALVLAFNLWECMRWIQKEGCNSSGTSLFLSQTHAYYVCVVKTHISNTDPSHPQKIWISSWNIDNVANDTRFCESPRWAKRLRRAVDTGCFRWLFLAGWLPVFDWLATGVCLAQTSYVAVVSEYAPSVTFFRWEHGKSMKIQWNSIVPLCPWQIIRFLLSKKRQADWRPMAEAVHSWKKIGCPLAKVIIPFGESVMLWAEIEAYPDERSYLTLTYGVCSKNCWTGQEKRPFRLGLN